MKIKECFLEKEFTQNERYAISVAYNQIIERETEKAYLIKWDTKFGIVTRWVPKSCVFKEYEIKEENFKEVDKMMKNKAGELLHIIKEDEVIMISDTGRKFAKVALMEA